MVGVFALGGLGLLHPFALLLLLILPLPGQARAAAAMWREALGSLRPEGFPSRCLLAALLVFLVGAFLEGLAPNTHYDVEAYHYALPSLYLKHHGIYWTGTSANDGLFQFSQLLAVPCLALGGEEAANLLGLLYLTLLCLVSASAVSGQVALQRHPAGNLAIHGAMALVASSPFLFLQASGGLAELPLMCWLMLAFEAWLLVPTQRRWQWLFLLYCGLAFTTKLTAFVPIVILCLSWPRGSLGVRARTGTAVLASGTWSEPGELIPSPVLRKRPTGGEKLKSWLLHSLATCPLLPSLSLDSREWQTRFNPLLLTGSLLYTGTAPALLPGFAGAISVSLLNWVDSRYVSIGLVWLVVPSSLALSRQIMSPNRRPIAWLCLLSLAYSGILMVALVGRRLPVILRFTSPQQYLRETDALHRVYDILARQPAGPDDYVWLLDRRGYRCPVPYVVADFGGHPLDSPDFARPARWILWNLSREVEPAALLRQELHDAGSGTHRIGDLILSQYLPRERIMSIGRVLGVACRSDSLTLDTPLRESKRMGRLVHLSQRPAIGPERTKSCWTTSPTWSVSTACVTKICVAVPGRP